MSTLKTNNAQIGQSATASNNFTWRQPAVPDGTVRLSQGNADAPMSDILIASAAGLAIGSPSIGAERIVVGTPQTTNGAAAYGYTGLPNWVKKITFVFKSVSTVNTVSRLFQLGTSSGYTSSGYNSRWAQPTGSTTNNASNSGSSFSVTGAFSDAHTGIAQFCLVDSATNTWVISCTSQNDTGNYYITTASGYVALSGALDRVQILPSTGNFNGGTINIIYEG